MTRLLMLIICLGAPLCAFSDAVFADGVVDTASAMRLCDEWGVSGAEGIWQLTDSDTQLLIFRRGRPDLPGLPVYDIIAVAPPDISVETGEILGSCTPTADPAVYVLELFTKRDASGALTGRKRLEARMDAAGRHLTASAEKSNIRINLTGLLPGLSRILRIYFDPVKKKIRGFHKIYPGIDPDGSMPGQIRML